MARNDWSSSPDRNMDRSAGRSRWGEDEGERDRELARQDRYQGNAFAWQRGRGPGQRMGSGDWYGSAGWTGGQAGGGYGGNGDYGWGGWGWGDERGGYGLYPSAQTGFYDRGYGRDPSFGPGMAWRQRPGDYGRDWHGWGVDRSGARDWDQGWGSDNDRGFLERAGDEVASWFGDEDARRRREQDYRGVGPRGYQRTDARISEDVCDRLSDDPVIDASGIDVAVEGGEVTLNGEVPSRQAKRAAEDCAERVSGVSHVQNNLRIKTTTTGSTTGGTAGALVAPKSTPV